MDLNWNNDNEYERLQDLKSYEILDTEPEEIFDQLTFLAANVCHTPIALLSFIDAERQWFKSTYGLEIHEIPRHISACNQTITQMGIYEIQDVDQNSCLYTQYMKQEGFRYYAGVPITSKHGYNMGSLCVIDRIPRVLSKEELQSLTYIASQIVDILEVRKKYRENLTHLKQMGEATYKSQGKFQDVVHRAGLRSMAELSTGLIYRLRPLSINIKRAVDRIDKKKESVKNLDFDIQLIKNSTEASISIFDGLEKFINAEKEKWMKPLDLNEVLNHVLKHMEYKFKEFQIDLKVSMEPDVWVVGNVSQLSEVFFSVINNAVEAVQNMQEKHIEVILKEENHYAVLLVKDSGRGLAENVSPFIFQPFFTTKQGNSLGIGLSLSQKLVHRHNGRIELVNSYGPTIFCIKLPVP